MSQEEYTTIIKTWKQDILLATLNKYNINTTKVIYNADQIGLFFNKMPNSTYIHSSKKNNARGVKAMHSKKILTLMVCVSADGKKCPLSIIGKPKCPNCFKFIRYPASIKYYNQKNAWFDNSVTLWWVTEVFWIHHLRTNGDVP